MMRKWSGEVFGLMVVCEYAYGRPAQCGGGPDSWEPEEADELELIAVYDQVNNQGYRHELSETLRELLNENELFSEETMRVIGEHVAYEESKAEALEEDRG